MVIATQQDGAGLAVPPITDGEFARFRELILRLTGIHLKDNKRHLLMARLARHIVDLGIDSFSSYYQFLAHDTSGEELRDLTNRITTNKTSFFREPHHFELLRSRLIPEVRQRGSRELRIWSAACSSGEEPYSIAITLREALGSHPGWDVRILASDIDTEMLERAQSGIYPLDSLAEIPDAQRRAHFLRGYGKYEGQAQVRPELCRMIDFRQIKLHERQWAVPWRFDVIFCRNVIIYFDRAMQQQVIQSLVSYLKPGGYLLLGHSESLYGHAVPLLPVGRTAYQLIGEGSRK